jgi:hypothetical protein
MKKLESLKSSLFDNFKESEVSKLNKIIGGATFKTCVTGENCSYTDKETEGSMGTSVDRTDSGTPGCP